MHTLRVMRGARSLRGGLPGATDSSPPFSSALRDTQRALDLGMWGRLTLGIKYRHNTLSSNALSQFSREDRLGLYRQNEPQLTPSVGIVAGSRYDLHTGNQSNCQFPCRCSLSAS